MTEQLNVQQMAQRLCAADNILILCHKNPDGDTIGSAAALYIDASGGSARTLSAIERANNALWTACNEKTRLVYLSDTSDQTLRAVRRAGYCPIVFDLDYRADPPVAGDILRKARSGGCIAYLGSDTNLQENWSALLARLCSSSRPVTALNELSAAKEA